MPETAPSVHQRLVLFGMPCAFTEAVLAAIRDAPAVTIAAIVLPGEPGDDPAWTAGIPVVRIRDRAGLRDPGFRTTLATFAPDLVVVACFPWLLPAWLRDLPGLGCLNIHPSLLPDGRGPEPVFWAFRWGLRETGVTIHRLDAGFDTGPIVAQRRLAIPDDATMPSLEADLAALGADLLLETLSGLGDGTVVALPQPAAGRYAPFPRSEDLIVPTSWPADRAARFIRAAVPVHGPLPVLVEPTGQWLAVDAVHGEVDNAAIREPVRIEGQDAMVRFTPGVLRLHLAMPARPLRLMPGSVRRPDR